MGKITASSGGDLTANISAKLVARERSALIRYQELRAEAHLPPLRFATLPMNGTGFRSIKELAPDENGERPVSFFRGVEGAGNFQEATLNIDLGIDAAEAFASRRHHR